MRDGDVPERVDDDEIARRIRRTVAGYEVPGSIANGVVLRPRRQDGLRIAVPATFVVLAILILSNLSRGIVDRSDAGSGATPAGSPGATLEQTPSLGTQSVAVPTQPDLRAYAWFSLQTLGPCPAGEDSQGMSACNYPPAPETATVYLTGSTLDGGAGGSTSYELPGMDTPSDLERARSVAFLGGDDEILYTANGSNGGSLRSLDLGTGDDREWLRIRDLIQDAVYDPSSGSVLATTVTVQGRADAGIWRLPLDGDAAVMLVAAREDLDITRRPDGWSRRIFLTPDSGRLIALDCVDFFCDARVFDPKDGRFVSSAADLRDETIYGATNGSLVGIFDCPKHPCRISAMAVESGALESVFEPCVEAGAALAPPTEGGERLAYGAAAGDDCHLGAVSSVDLETKKARPIWSADSSKELALQIVERGPGLGYSAPPGWVAVGPGGGFVAEAGEEATAILLNLADGRVLPL
jgi:hypothetical protein